ncbi:ATP-binding protein [Litoribrevibacter albus]|uniref:histidine kinase n=1 Tax=Litoribrevibacter albus TaxID=1473156 RepID=A0AA37SAX2_9GAMM|nr:ATP-binding protein [Litoribrevibacter albus]GLQ31929.1 two-component sensor histidine kinase [Litoribrevibacter albus]
MILIAVILAFNVYSFYQGLLEYVKEKEITAVKKVAELMTTRVTQEEIKLRRISPRDWNDAIKDSLLSVGDEDERNEILRQEQRKRNYKDSSGRQPRIPPPPAALAKNIALTDLDKVPVFGEILPEEGVNYYPIYKGDKLTAYVAHKPAKSVFAKQEEEFIRHQVIGYLLISLVALMVCVYISWQLANRISHPVMLVAKGARQLSSGNYGINVELTNSESKLKDEIGRLVKDFNYLSKVLEKNEESRLNWSSDIAHELRTPVAVLKGEIEAIVDGVRPLSMESVDSLREEVDMLEKMIADLRLLTLSDAGALDYHMEAVDLSSILRQTVSAMEPLFSKAGLTLKYTLRGKSRSVHGDRARLKQLINNLLSNSLKYTDAPSEVVVSLDIQNNLQTITVEDGAPGVPTESLPLLFERLYRVDKSRSRSTGGSGLGMAICKNIVEAHDGTICCSHSALGGLKVTITFKD